jgi:hypothetical protein
LAIEGEGGVKRAAMSEPSDAAIAERIEALLGARQEGSSICPSEVARSFSSQERLWRALMPQIRRVADALAAQGRVHVTQRGQSVRAQDAKGPIRLHKGNGKPG